MSKYFTVKEVISGLPEEKVPHRLLIDTINEKLVYDLDEDTRIDLSNASELLKKQDKFAEISEHYMQGIEVPISVSIDFNKSADISARKLYLNLDEEFEVVTPYHINMECSTTGHTLILGEYDNNGVFHSGIMSNESKISINGSSAGINVEGNSGSITGNAIAIMPYITDEEINENVVPLFDYQADGAAAVLVSSNESRVRLYADYIDLGKSYPEIDLKNGVVSNVNSILGVEDIGLSINYLHEPELSHQAATKNYVDKSLPIISADEPMPEEGRIWLQPANVSTGAVDYIVERGIIGNWHYTKWASGECEAYGVVTVQATSSTQNGSTYYSNIVSASMPFAITDATVTGSFGTAHWISNCYTSGSNVCFRLNRGASITINADISGNIVVKGLWK